MQQRITSHRKMGYGEHAAHIFMCCITGGLWAIVYASALRRRTTVTTIPVTPLRPAFPPPPCTTCGAPSAAHVGGYCPPPWAARPVRD